MSNTTTSAFSPPQVKQTPIIETPTAEPIVAESDNTEILTLLKEIRSYVLLLAITSIFLLFSIIGCIVLR